MAKIDIRFNIDQIEEMEDELQEREYINRRSNASAREYNEVAPVRRDKRNKVSRGKDKFFNENAY